jgi:hypothetical protein
MGNWWDQSTVEEANQWNPYSGGGGVGGSWGDTPWWGQSTVAEANQDQWQTPVPAPAPSAAQTTGGGYTPPAPAPASNVNMDAIIKQQQDMANAAKAEQERIRQERIKADIETISRLYQEALTNLGISEGQAKANWETTQSTIGSQYGQSKSEVVSALERALRSLGLQREEAGNISATQMQKAQDIANTEKTDQEIAKRDALAQIGQSVQGAQQSAMNFLGARGVTDSSAGQAMGELLYRQGSGDIAKTMQTMQTNMEKINKTLGQNIMDINNDYSTNIKNIQNEETNAQSFYQDSIGKLETAKNTQLAEAKTIFDNELLRINQLREQYGKTKESEIKSAEAEAWNNFQNNVFQIDQQLGQQKMSLDQWAMERQAALDDAKEMAKFNASLSSGGGSSTSYDLVEIGGKMYNYNPKTGELMDTGKSNGGTSKPYGQPYTDENGDIWQTNEETGRVELIKKAQEKDPYEQYLNEPSQDSGGNVWDKIKSFFGK